MKITVSLVAVAVFLAVEVIKKYPKLESYHIPPLAIFLGIAFNFLVGEYVGIVDWQLKIFWGFMMACSAMGLWSGGKTLFEIKNVGEENGD